MTPEQFAAKLRAVGQVGVARAVGKTLVSVALIAEGEAKGRVPVLNGHLRNSIAGKVRQGAQGPEAVVAAGGRVEGAADVVYAGVIEYGFKGMAKPKNAQFFRIPLGPARTQGGQDRYPTPIRESGRGLFYVRRSKDGEGALLIHKASGVPWYKLVRSLRPRAARPFLRPGAEEAARRLPAQFAKHLKTEIDAAR
jgi:hypothetical protein